MTVNFLNVVSVFIRAARNGIGLLVLAASSLLLLACKGPDDPIIIGFIGGLTGKSAGLGIAGRDGVLLAAEEVNLAGGIHGRNVMVIAQDDRQDAEAARRTFKELLNAGAIAVVGPMTSSIAEAIYPEIIQSQVVTVSPLVTSSQFSGRDDNFLHMSMPSTIPAERLANHILRNRLRNVSICLDIDNAAYSEDWLNAFTKSFLAAGGRIVSVEKFSSGTGVGFLPMIEHLLGYEPDALIMIAGARDTAMAAQQVRKVGSTIPLFATECSFTGDVINFGGKAVEGMGAYLSYDPDSRTARSERFQNDFRQRFGYQPSYASNLSYEAAKFVFQGLASNPRREELRQNLLDIEEFSGLQGPIQFNKYGDPLRPTFFVVIGDGRFKSVEE